MKWTVQGDEEYALKLSQIGNPAAVRAICNMAVYDGAKIVADAVRTQIQGLQTVSDKSNLYRYRKKEPARLSESQKQGLLDGLGLAHFNVTDGFINTKIGFNGYNSIKTKKYTNGQPNAMIARMVEHGASTFVAQPFIRKAVNACMGTAIAAMDLRIDEEIAKMNN